MKFKDANINIYQWHRIDIEYNYLVDWKLGAKRARHLSYWILGKFNFSMVLGLLSHGLISWNRCLFCVSKYLICSRIKEVESVVLDTQLLLRYLSYQKTLMLETIDK